MKKNLLALAILAGCSAAASAQTSVAVYGVVDVGLASVTGATASTNVPTPSLPAYSNGNELKLRDGIMQGSRLGFRGAEDLGDGNAAIFTLEMGILTDTGASDQGGTLFGRQAFVGLKGNNWGQLTLGRQYAPHYLAWKSIDPMDDGFAGAGGNLLPTNGKRINNAIRYATPVISGFSGEILYGLGEVAGSTSSSRTLGGTLTYQDGPLLVKAAYHELNNATATDKSKNSMIGATYNFGPAKAHLSYGTNKGAGTLDTTDLMAGVSVPMGLHSVMVSYISKDDKASTNRDASQWALAYTYLLSKRTNLYASWADITNKNGAAFRTASATAPSAGQTGAVGGTTEYNVGIRHSF